MPTTNSTSEACPLIWQHERHSTSDIDDKPQIDDEVGSLPYQTASTERRGRKPLWSRTFTFATIHSSLIVLYTVAYLVLLYQSQTHNEIVYSPAKGAIRYQKQRFDAELVIESDYIGEPSPQVDLAWHELLQNMNIAVPRSDLDRLGTFSIEVPDEPDMFIAGLSVYHELHCLKRLRQYTWLDYYFPNQTAEDARLHRLHTDHCIDVLRQAILCHADVSLFTLQWSEAERMPRADFSHEHQCVDWDRVNEWAAARAVPEEKMRHLQHPWHGPAFPDGKGSLIGGSEDHSPAIHEHP